MSTIPLLKPLVGLKEPPKICDKCGARFINEHLDGWNCRCCGRIFYNIAPMEMMKLIKYKWSDVGEKEWMRQLYVDEGLPCGKVGKIVGKSRAAVQYQITKLGVMRR